MPHSPKIMILLVVGFTRRICLANHDVSPTGDKISANAAEVRVFFLT